MDAAFSFACASRCASSAVTEDRQALYAEQIRPVIEPVCRTQAIELEKAFQANDALWATFSQKTEARRTAATVAPSGLVASGVLGALEQIQHNLDFIPATGGVLGLSVIAAVSLGARAHQQPRWDQAAGLELTLDAARDWLREVHAGHLDPARARQMLRDRVTPRLADWDVHILDAVLYRIADQLEDRASGRASLQ